MKKSKKSAQSESLFNTGAREEDNVKHWRWAYYWEEKLDGEWINRSKNIRIRQLYLEHRCLIALHSALLFSR